jgi:hypothetical protein
MVGVEESLTEKMVLRGHADASSRSRARLLNLVLNCVGGGGGARLLRVARAGQEGVFVRRIPQTHYAALR